MLFSIFIFYNFEFLIPKFSFLPIIMAVNYDLIIKERAEKVFRVLATRVSVEDMTRIRQAFELAREAHSPQKRKTGEPYILHPIAVADICARELNLDVNSIIAAFLHDVVEDTSYTIEDIKSRFGDDVAFLVRVVTKQKKEKYTVSKQVDNYRQMLNSVQYDIRALLVKLADRLHNMRTLSSMRPDKQMKIAGETDYFYAPLANRLGLYHVKTELENLSLRFRCPHEYAEIDSLISMDRNQNRAKIDKFMDEIRKILAENGIEATVSVDYRRPYSLYRKMQKYGDDFNHLKYRHFIEIVFPNPTDGSSEKEMILKIYALLTDRFKEKPGGISNYIDSPKENGYRSFHLKLMADFGRWQEVHISSERMARDSRIGCMAEDDSVSSVRNWIDKFRNILRDIAQQGQDGTNFIQNVVTSFYNDDIMTFTPNGKPIVLPQKATVLDFAFEVHTDLGLHAQYARINNQLSSIKTQLHRGDVVTVFASPSSHPEPDWLKHTVTYKARKNINAWLAARPKEEFLRCEICNPIPGEEVIGFRMTKGGDITLHKRNCHEAIRLASQHGDSIVSVDYKESNTLYPVTVEIRAVDRYHLFIDIVDCVSNTCNLSIDSIHTETEDSIVTCRITFGVHSYDELQRIITHITAIPGVDEVKRFKL